MLILSFVPCSHSVLFSFRFCYAIHTHAYTEKQKQKEIEIRTALVYDDEQNLDLC